MSLKSIVVPLELGHKAAVLSLNERTPEFTHSWEVFVQGPNGVSIENFVQKVVFSLHETFDNPKRVLRAPPFRIQEKGYGAFNLPIEIHFKTSDPQIRKARFEYDLFLQSLDSDPLVRIRKEKVTFTKPSEDFRKKLLQGGGIEVPHSDDGQMNGKSSVSRPSSGAKIKPTVRHTNTPASSSSDSNQRKQKPEPRKETSKPKIKNAFTDLFGEPITSSENKIIKDKLTHSREKDKERSKDKDHDKHSSKSEHKKESDREKNSEKHSKKDREKSHKKSSKDKERPDKHRESNSTKSVEKERSKHSKGESRDSKERKSEKDKISKYEYSKRSISPASSVASDSSTKKRRGEKNSKKVPLESKRPEKPPQETVPKSREREKVSNSSKPPKEPDKNEKIKSKESVAKLHKSTPPVAAPTLPPPQPSVSSPRQSREKSKSVAKVEKSPTWNSKDKKSENKSSPKLRPTKEKSKSRSQCSPALVQPPQPSTPPQIRNRSSSTSSSSSSPPRRSRSKSSSSSRSSSYSRERSRSQSSSPSRSRSRSSSSSKSKSSSVARSKSTSRSRSQTPRGRSRSVSSDQRRSKSKSSHTSRSSSSSSCGSCPSQTLDKAAEKITNTAAGNIAPLQILMTDVGSDSSSDSEKDFQTRSPINDLPPPRLPPPRDSQKKATKQAAAKVKETTGKTKSRPDPSSIQHPSIVNPAPNQTMMSSSSDDDQVRMARPSREKRRKRKNSHEEIHSNTSSPKTNTLLVPDAVKVNGLSSPAKVKAAEPIPTKAKMKEDPIKEESANLIPTHLVKNPPVNEHSPEYLEELLLLRNKIESSFSNRPLLQEIVNIIGEFSSINNENLDFDLMALDQKTIRRLQHVVK